jgi:hypothetical protein
MSAYRRMSAPVIDDEAVYDVAGVSLTARDFTLKISSGKFHFFEPVTIDGQDHRWGGYLTGDVRFQFAPTPSMERVQMKRYFDADTLDRMLVESILLFTDSLAAQIMREGTLVSVSTDDARKDAADLYEFMNRREEHSFVFEALRNIAAPQRRPFLLVNARPVEGNIMFYVFNPYEREEVRLLQEHKEFIVSLFMHPAVSYSVYADETNSMLNGINRERISCEHYSIDAAVNRNGEINARTELTCRANLAGTQLVTLRLNELLTLDSVRSADGSPVPFLRHVNWKNKSADLHLFLDHPLQQDETADLIFYYQGEVIERDGRVFYEKAGSNWYPRYGLFSAATFDLTFRTPVELTLGCTATKTGQRPEAEELVTQWVAEQAVTDLTFILGDYRRDEFRVGEIPVLLYLSEPAFREMLEKYQQQLNFASSNRYDIVTQDMANALKFFSEYIGPYKRDKLLIAESFSELGESYPGLVNVTWSNLLYDDPRGENRLLRADLTARQWWGQGVRFDSYHDQWLADAFAAYSALMYVQAAQGNEAFTWWLDNFRDHIFSAYDEKAGKREEHGAIAIGSRSSALTNQLATQITTARSFGTVDASRRTRFGQGTSAFENVAGGEGVLSSKAEIMQEGFGGIIDTAEQPALNRQLGLPYNLMVYHRGAYVLHMLRNMLLDMQTLDDGAFFDLLKEFYQTWYGKRPTTMDFKRLVDQYCGIDMTWFFDQWVYGQYLPRYKFSWDVDRADGTYKAVVHIKQQDVPPGFKMFVPVEIDFGGDRKAYIRLLVDRPELDVTLPPLESKPDNIRFNPFNSVLAKVDQ